MEIGKSREEALHGNQRTGWRIARKVVFRILIYADLDPDPGLNFSPFGSGSERMGPKKIHKIC